MRAIVVGAGVFGVWTALHLLRRGVAVTLIDAWSPGHSRASSGGDTRVLRHSYGAQGLYTRWVMRSAALWREHAAAWGLPLIRRTGLLWMVQADEAVERASVEQLGAHGVAYEVLQPEEIARRYPQINLSGIRWALFEAETCVLLARRSCTAVAQAVVDEGGSVRVGAVRPGPVERGRMAHVVTDDGERHGADVIVFACGPWLGRVFPELLGGVIRVTRQEAFLFGVPAGDVLHGPARLPVWSDHGTSFWYGIPDAESRGFKVADDTRGPAFDPESGDRTATREGADAAREYVAFRFPGLARAPLLEARVCQYATTPDGDFLLDRHPEASNVWIAGGGSGHGFKHGPALGEHLASCIVDGAPPERVFRVDRFAGG